ncbi:MAG: diaminopimelate epimerase [Cyclobacteriaceae bacterium]|nr:diaminopimelate epimerase [Cyclobacteriaceae bacterium]
MLLSFVKYQGTGNDFIIIDNRDSVFPTNDSALIRQLTDRKFGIGADGLMLVENDEGSDFRMRYFNADGSQSLCGNGSRCAIDFAGQLGIISQQTNFNTTDGLHHAFFKDGWVYFQLHPVDGIKGTKNDFFIHNGSPHHIRFVEDVSGIDVLEEGRKIRYSDAYQPAGTNVNFVQITGNTLKVRTYERGVENETLSCGTGVTAAALAATTRGLSSPVRIETPGGQLEVSFVQKPNAKFTDIYLAGPATRVFEGQVEI